MKLVDIVIYDDGVVSRIGPAEQKEARLLARHFYSVPAKLWKRYRRVDKARGAVLREMRKWPEAKERRAARFITENFVTIPEAMMIGERLLDELKLDGAPALFTMHDLQGALRRLEAGETGDLLHKAPHAVEEHRKFAPLVCVIDSNEIPEHERSGEFYHPAVDIGDRRVDVVMRWGESAAVYSDGSWVVLV
jgi:hypothetical protein